MKNNNDDALAEYFDSMLSETKSELPVIDTAVIVAEKPVKVVALPEVLRFAEPEVAQNVEEIVVETPAIEIAVQTEAAPQPELESWKNIAVEDEFQVLFFGVSGLTFAVPLTDLGGINHLDDSINQLFGKPDWFSGVMTHHKALFNIVDTAQWVNTGESAETLNYSHYIVLGKTQWGLSCEKLMGTETLVKSQIKWRKSEGKRPWLAGMVKDKMCALIHVEELVKLLNNGMNIDGV